ncbi:HAMP domain-containing sensor histidine kinase [Anaerocolumna aminovalerica]
MFILLFNIALNSGFILPANYAEHYLEINKSIIGKSEPFDKALIPYTCKYGLFDFNGNYLSGDFSEDIVDDAKVFIKDAKKSNNRFILIERANEYCVIQYDISVHFSSYTLDKLFPKFELMYLILFFIIFIVIVINNALHFGRKLKKELKPVLEEISQIQNRELNVERKNSKIKEFNDILLSLYDMETALSQSLKKEWETEQKRKSNISALAHDIKTPLTVIKGNSELILEENNIAEIYQLADLINSNSDRIERYIKLLIDETNNTLTSGNEEKVTLTTLIDGIIKASEVICNLHGIEQITHNKVFEVDIIINRDLVERAVLNLIQNAIEHTNSKKMIKLYFECLENKLVISVEDFGKGFTSEALKYAKNQFYTEKSERSEEHYGLGMYFASNVAEKYNGGITYYNKSDQTGAMVIFEIKIC